LFGDKFIAGHHMYRKLRHLDFPEGYQVLCMNYNVANGAGRVRRKFRCFSSELRLPNQCVTTSTTHTAQNFCC
jgi:hypothetical protein